MSFTAVDIRSSPNLATAFILRFGWLGICSMFAPTPDTGVSLTIYACRTGQHVALKILTADSYDGKKDTFEREILRHIASKTTQAPSIKPGSNRILGLLDEFQYSGPNGKHVCLVFKPMGPSMSTYRRLFPRLKIPVPVAKNVARQLLEALAFLHDTCHIIHTGNSSKP